MFNETQYKKQYYQENKEVYKERDRLKYIKNREHILQKRREALQNETPQKRAARLKYLKEYRLKNRKSLREKTQNDEPKFRQYINSAKRRDYEFSLTLGEFKDIFHSNCYYCGDEDARGIDRIDNLKGYIKENCSPCCEMCNKMKWKYSKEEFLKQIKNIYKNIS